MGVPLVLQAYPSPYLVTRWATAIPSVHREIFRTPLPTTNNSIDLAQGKFLEIQAVYCKCSKLVELSKV